MGSLFDMLQEAGSRQIIGASPQPPPSPSQPGLSLKQHVLKFWDTLRTLWDMFGGYLFPPVTITGIHPPVLDPPDSEIGCFNAPSLPLSLRVVSSSIPPSNPPISSKVQPLPSKASPALAPSTASATATSCLGSRLRSAGP